MSIQIILRSPPDYARRCVGAGLALKPACRRFCVGRGASALSSLEIVYVIVSAVGQRVRGATRS